MDLTQSFIDNMYKTSQNLIEQIERSSDPALFDKVAQFARDYVGHIPYSDDIVNDMVARAATLKNKYYGARSDLKRVPFEELIDMILSEMNIWVKKLLETL